MIAPLLLLAQAAATSPEADALGVRLARTGTLASIAPMMVEKDAADLAAQDAALGHGYATRLSLADLRLLVAQNESAAAMAGAGTDGGGIDVKKQAAARICTETGKLCDRH